MYKRQGCVWELEEERYELREKLLEGLSVEEAREVLREQLAMAEFEANCYRVILEERS